MTQHPEPVVRGERWPDGYFRVWSEGTGLYGVGMTPLDAIRDLLDAEVKRADAWLKTVQP